MRFGFDDFLLKEVFDAPLKLKYHSELTKEVKGIVGSKVQYVRVWFTEYKNETYYFYEFKRKGYWEYHFNHQDLELKQLDLYKNDPTKIYATIIDLYRKKFEEDKPIKIYAQDKRTHMFYDKIVRRMNKKRDIKKEIEYGKDTSINGEREPFIAVQSKNMNENLFRKIHRKVKLREEICQSV